LQPGVDERVRRRKTGEGRKTPKRGRERRGGGFNLSMGLVRTGGEKTKEQRGQRCVEAAEKGPGDRGAEGNC